MQPLGSSRPQAIFFDLDETLVDNTRPMQRLFVEVFEVYFPACVVHGRLEADIAQALKTEVYALWESLFETDSDDLMATMFRSTLRQCQLDVSAASAMARHLVDAAANALQLRPGAAMLLEQLNNAGIATGIITNGIEVLQMAKIE
ncbi:MAG: HAD hydrolase-like protein, partial [Gammaproteobacteria bacterium]|nr:HAD hydrolase-like protein [Gammaproteobacteria bacterium]